MAEDDRREIARLGTVQWLGPKNEIAEGGLIATQGPLAFSRPIREIDLGWRAIFCRRLLSPALSSARFCPTCGRQQA